MSTCGLNGGHEPHICPICEGLVWLLTSRCHLIHSSMCIPDLLLGLTIDSWRLIKNHCLLMWFILVVWLIVTHTQRSDYKSWSPWTCFQYPSSPPFFLWHKSLLVWCVRGAGQMTSQGCHFFICKRLDQTEFLKEHMLLRQWNCAYLLKTCHVLLSLSGP